MKGFKGRDARVGKYSKRDFPRPALVVRGGPCVQLHPSGTGHSEINNVIISSLVAGTSLENLTRPSRMVDLEILFGFVRRKPALSPLQFYT